MAKRRGRRKRLNPELKGSEAEKLRSDLEQMVVGQEEAVVAIADIYQKYLVGMNQPGRPIGNFLFLGPTGTGKTYIVEAAAQLLLGNSRAVIKIDCSEFQHSHEICKLIGSPPGYLGHKETKPVFNQSRLDEYHTENITISIVLFDEIEKAHDALWHLLLGILDKAELTLGDNTKTDFSNTLIFMASNLGAPEMQSLMRQSLGFSPAKQYLPNQERIFGVGMEAAKKRFTPEFINRLDKMVVFQRLEEGQLRKILRLELGYVQERILAKTQFSFQITEAVRDFLMKEGFDPKYGARHLKRAVERFLVSPMSNLIASEQVHAGDLIEIGLDSRSGKFVFDVIAEGVSPYGEQLNKGFHSDDEDDDNEDNGGEAANSAEAGTKSFRASTDHIWPPFKLPYGRQF